MVYVCLHICGLLHIVWLAKAFMKPMCCGIVLQCKTLGATTNHIIACLVIASKCLIWAMSATNRIFRFFSSLSVTPQRISLLPSGSTSLSLSLSFLPSLLPSFFGGGGGREGSCGVWGGGRAGKLPPGLSPPPPWMKA